MVPTSIQQAVIQQNVQVPAPTKQVWTLAQCFLMALKMALKLAEEFAQELAQELAQGLVQEHGDAVVASFSFYIGL